MARSKNHCNFCGRSEDEVRILLTGLHGYICDDCVDSAYHVIEKSLGVKPREKEEKNNASNAKKNKI